MNTTETANNIPPLHSAGQSVSRSCIFVLGTGRSGTSALTGALHRLGVNIGTNLIDGDTYNPTGYYENRAIVDINQNIFEILDSYHGDFAPLPAEWVSTPALHGLSNRIASLLAANFTHSKLFAIKDPRLCRLLPVWKSAILESGVIPGSILVLRNPFAVVRSLFSRGIPVNLGLMWWLAYILDSERHSRGAARAVLQYDQLLEDPEYVLNKAADQLSLSWPRPCHEARAEIASFLNTALRHHDGRDPATRSIASPDLCEISERVFNAFISSSSDGELACRADGLADEFNELVRRYRGWRLLAVRETAASLVATASNIRTSA